jgi:hypothetical protein
MRVSNVLENAFSIEMQPGDATRYEFLVVPGKDDTVLVFKQNGTDFQHTFTSLDLELFQERAQDAIEADYESYQTVVDGNEWLNERFFKLAVALKHNPWTLLAAAIAACEVPK